MLTDYTDRLWSTANDAWRNRRLFSHARNLLQNVRVTARKKSRKSILSNLPLSPLCISVRALDVSDANRLASAK